MDQTGRVFAGVSSEPPHSLIGRHDGSAQSLLELASRKFGTLTSAEQRFFSAVAEGQFPDFSSHDSTENDPATGSTWPVERTLAADRIAWLASDADAVRHITHRGIGIKGAHIDGRLDLQAANIVFALYFDRCAIPAGINLLGAEIHALNLTGSHTGRITADGVRVESGIAMRSGFVAHARVRLIGARLGGNLDCNGGTFLGSDGEALLADSLKVDGSVLMGQQFCAHGEVRLLGAEIGGNLSCDGGQFLHAGKTALAADRAKIEGNVFLSDGFMAQGRISLPSATINGFFVWRTVQKPEEVVLDLRSAHLATLVFRRDSWPSQGKLFLHGLTYDLLDDQQTFGADTWIQWLRLQPTKPFRPQPYEQLAAVLRKDGKDGDAKQVQYAKECDRARRTTLTWSEVPWYRIFGPLIGYGFKPWRAFWLSLLVIIGGAAFFNVGTRHGLMVPSKPEGFVTVDGQTTFSENYPQLSTFMYSLDTFTPLISLDQADYWLPAANRGAIRTIGPIEFTTGSLLRVYLWFHIVAGWTLSTLLFVGLTGSIPGG